MEGESDKEVVEPVGERTLFYSLLELLSDMWRYHGSRVGTSQQGVVGITGVYLHI